MSTPQTIVEANLTHAIASTLKTDFENQRAAYLKRPIPTVSERKNDLAQLKRMLNENREILVDAICKDYGNRSKQETLFAEFIPVTDGINVTRRSVRKWMKEQRRHIDFAMFPGGKNRVIPQPLGVVGLIIPWNFPINLCFSQLTAVFAAGNRAMVKMSENSIALTRVLIDISPKYFSEDKLKFYEETGGVGIQFSQVPFDLMIFTGSGQTGRAVMTSAAKNLTPVILELGGKAPAIIDPKFPLNKAVERIMYVKQFNTGQICTNVDYVFVHESQKQEFVEFAKAYARKHSPDIEHEDYTSIIDDRSFTRLSNVLKDAQDQGATVINLTPDQSPNPATRKMPIHLVLDTSEEMTIRHRETFGPILMVMTYDQAEEVIEYINNHDRPLALYPFSYNKKLVRRYTDRIMSGGVTVNDALFHVAQHDIPFGGVGPSGMGHYHGYEGFVSCSKMRPVFHQARFSSIKHLAPPYNNFAKRTIDFLVKFKS